MTRILVTGANGQLGQDLVAAARAGEHEVTGVSRSSETSCDITDRSAVTALVARLAPELIIHAAAWTAVDDCEADPERAVAVNQEGTRNVGDAADGIGAHVVYVSTDYVFDGTKATPYAEDDPTNPLSAYGRSKLGGEQALGTHHTIARTSWVCGAHGPNMVKTILRLAAAQPELRFVDDQVGHPSFTADLAPALIELGLLRAPGPFHVTNTGAVSWHGFAQAVLAAAGQDPARVHPVHTVDLTPPRPAPRPANSVLADHRRGPLGLAPLRPYAEPLAELVAQLQA